NRVLEIAEAMGMNGKGWGWTPFIFSALGRRYDPALPVNGKTALGVWKDLPEWTEDAPPAPPSHFGVETDEVQERLGKLLGFEAEQRPAQQGYAQEIARAFEPPRTAGAPHIVLAEAGTGTGKTLGYLAPASVWAEKNKAAVWISTYTKNLQRQIDQELDKLYPDARLKEVHTATRKGRENYLCLLNLEETAAGAALAKDPSTMIAAGIMARWAAACKDGDLSGAQFPGWLAGLLGWRHTLGLANKRGECIYAACDHYRKCFIEHSVRRAQHARIVVANHALVMVNAALARADEDLPGHYIFDEGHHLFDAADSAFSSHLSARETRDFRRWLLGMEDGRRASRSRGLKRRAEDLIEGDAKAEELLKAILNAAEALTMSGWSRRLRDGSPSGPCEQFLALVYRQVFARADGREGPYSLETQSFPVDPDLLDKARVLKGALIKLQTPMRELAGLLHKKLAEDEGMMSSDTRARLEALGGSLDRRAGLMLQGWIDMLGGLDKGPPPLHPDAHQGLEPIGTGPRIKPGATKAFDEQNAFVDWMEIERVDGRAVDVGLYRHFIDPMKPFAASLQPALKGMVVTSATLRDNSAESDSAQDWESAKMRAGVPYFTPDTLQTSHFSSPFDYAAQTKVFIINDVNKNDLAQVAGAYRALFSASGGGALGLFTAISRLRSVYERIAADLDARGLPLYAQHIDEIDTGTLVDMFREDVHACLLGTDAIRDGVDVPGNSLRLIAFDRVPWPRPTILHKARREAFGGRSYDEMLTRLKLKQAFGRLIRRSGDKGVFVMLDSGLPSRLHSAFPPETEIVKTGLKEAVDAIQAFFPDSRL
ncbi:MAG: ATP-dependent DNA helicase, partial [Alphaproteobacteria bacterium]|nr:ATP-dependent DNA helicase [Alphaproteobacteria bacterium]